MEQNKNKAEETTIQNQQNEAISPIDYVNLKFKISNAERDLIQKDIAPNLTKEEFRYFIILCQKSGLDPFLKEVYPLKFGSEKFFIVISVHKLFEIIAKEPSFAGFSKAEFEWDEGKKNLISCTKSIRQYKEGRVLDIYTSTLYFDECAAKKTNGSLNPMWEEKPTRMLEKCVDAHLCRRFPITQNYSLNGLYIEDEVRDAEYTDVTPKDPKFKIKKVEEKALEVPVNKETAPPTTPTPPTQPAPPTTPPTPPPPPPATPPTPPSPTQPATPPTTTKKEEFDMSDLFDNC